VNILALIRRWRDRADSPPVAGQGRLEQQPSRNLAGKWPDTTSLLVQCMSGMHFDPAQFGNNALAADKEKR
jgi:hypothetical protein